MDSHDSAPNPEVASGNNATNGGAGPVRRLRGRPANLNGGEGPESGRHLLAYLNNKRWKFGKPAGGSAIVVFNPKYLYDFDLLKNGDNGNAELLLPDDNPNWDRPGVMDEMFQARIIPMITREREPKKLFVPFSRTWEGSRKLVKMFVDPANKSIMYSFVKLSSAMGFHKGRPQPLKPAWAEIYDQIQWPSLEVVEAAIPKISWESACEEWEKFSLLIEDVQDKDESDDEEMD